MQVCIQISTKNKHTCKWGNSSHSLQAISETIKLFPTFFGKWWAILSTLHSIRSVCVRKKQKGKDHVYKEVRTLSIKETIIDKYQTTIQTDLWVEARNIWPGVQKKNSFHSSSLTLLSPLSAFPDTPFIICYNAIILSLTSSHKHTCKCSPSSYTLAHTWLCVSAYNQLLLKDTNINQRQTHLLSMYGSLINPDAAYRLIVKSQTLLQGQSTFGHVWLFWNASVFTRIFAHSLFPATATLAPVTWIMFLNQLGEKVQQL